MSYVRRFAEMAGEGSHSHLGRCGDEKNRRTGSSLKAAGLHPFPKFGAKLNLNIRIVNQHDATFLTLFRYHASTCFGLIFSP
jgi:hypothetical protein